MKKKINEDDWYDEWYIYILYRNGKSKQLKRYEKSRVRREFTEAKANKEAVKGTLKRLSRVSKVYETVEDFRRR